MKIVKLQAENVKRLQAVEIEPDGALVQITGRNGAGKSSVLDSIWWALAGERSHQAAPIRRGENVATISLDLGDVVVTREFARKDDDSTTTRIRVETAEGARFPSPQKMLDKLLGVLTFDPLAFSRASDRDQVEMLSGLCDIDMAAVAAENASDYTARREHNRIAKARRSAAEQIDVPADTPAQAVSVADIARRIREAEAHNRELENERRRREEIERSSAESEAQATSREQNAEQDERLANERAAQLEAQAREMREHAQETARQSSRIVAELRRAAAEQRAELAELPVVEVDVDTSELQAQIEDAERVNAAIAARDRRDDLLGEAAQAERDAKNLTERMDRRRETAREAIAAAELPVDGLFVEDGRVMLGDLPLEVASDAERLRVSCAVAMRGDAKLRVLRVRDGSLLDPDSLELLRQMAEAADYQVWVEMVDVSGKVGVVIEDGRVKSC